METELLSEEGWLYCNPEVTIVAMRPKAPNHSRNNVRTMCVKPSTIQYNITEVRGERYTCLDRCLDAHSDEEHGETFPNHPRFKKRSIRLFYKNKSTENTYFIDSSVFAILPVWFIYMNIVCFIYPPATWTPHLITGVIYSEPCTQVDQWVRDIGS